jgi:hypothetical protein
MSAALDMTTEVEGSETGSLRRLAANRPLRFLLCGRARMLSCGHFSRLPLAVSNP